MLHDRFTIGLCCMAMHKEPVKTFLDSFVKRMEMHNEYLLLIYHCFDDIASDISDSSNAASIFGAISYDALDAMIVYQSDEHQHDIFKEICFNCAEHGIPVISIDIPFDNAYNVSFGYGEAFSKIVEHVITEHNCRKIKHMAGIKGNDFTQTRIDCCAQVMKDHGLEFGENDVMYGEFWDYPTRVAMDNFFASGEEMPDAFICANDAMAMSVCSKLSEKGYSVPEDLMVLSWKNIIFRGLQPQNATMTSLPTRLLKLSVKSGTTLTQNHTALSFHTPLFFQTAAVAATTISMKAAPFSQSL